jgi:hypothetical protein
VRVGGWVRSPAARVLACSRGGRVTDHDSR